MEGGRESESMSRWLGSSGPCKAGLGHQIRREPRRRAGVRGPRVDASRASPGECSNTGGLELGAGG